MKITNCRVNHIINPIGYQFDRLVFSFSVAEARGKRQAGAEIRIAADEKMEHVLYDTGMSDGIDSLGTEISLPLEPRMRYYWTVSVRSDAGEEAVSAVSFFETGKMEEPWIGSVISCNRGEKRHPVFIKEFCLEKGREIDSARLYITGLGLYCARINGRPVTAERLTPYYTDYAKWVQYQTYDVKGLLEQENRIEVMLGNGWYSGRFGFQSRPESKGFYGDDWKLLAELRVKYRDGTETVLGTDGTWEVLRSNLIFSNIYDGERRDDTLEALPVESAVTLEEKMPVRERMSLPVLVHEELPARELIDTPAGEKVFDIGQNMAGSFRLRVHEPKGARIWVQVGEVLQDGNFYRGNLRTAKAEYIYISDGQEHILEPRFTFYGFRYAKVEGCGHLRREDFTGLAYYSDVTPVGSLVTGNEKLNRLISNIRWGQKSNFIDIPTDCPQRDERMGWTADTQVFVPTASYFTDSFAFYRRYLYELRGEQGEDGCVPDVVPRTGVDGGCSVWADAATIIPWKLYEFYGDRSILEESFSSMKAWVDYITRVDGNDHGWERVFHYGDWLALDHPGLREDTTAGGTEEGFIADVYYLLDCRIVQKSAQILGRTEDAEKYAVLADRIETYIADEFFTKNGRLAIATQTGYTLALYYGLSRHPDKLKKRFLKLLKDCDHKLKTGFVGTPLILKVLSMLGEDKTAYKILYNEEYPGWLYEVNLGATTIWERWNSLEPDGKVSSTGMNSLNHYAYGAVGEWMWRTIGGLSPDLSAPGFRKVSLRPIPEYKTGSCECKFRSPAGVYRLRWDVMGVDRVRLKVSVPFNCTAVLRLPWASDIPKEQTLEAGEYEFYCRTEEPLKRVYTVDDTVEELLGDAETRKKLEAIAPGVTQVPAIMREMPLRNIIVSYLPGGDEMLDMINEKLK